MRVDELDKNFAVDVKINEKTDIYDAECEPIKLFGGFREGDAFRRVPASVTERVNEGVHDLASHTSGIRIRFATDSKKIAIYATHTPFSRFDHMALTGQCGFDLYADDTGYVATFRPPSSLKNGYESIVASGSDKMRTYTIFFPLYSGIKKLYIGLCEGAKLEAPTPYEIEAPIVYYGSSITQGGCASKPGDSYQAFISRELKANFLNLGFSGSARGEFTIAKYISSLEMSAFVYDYDHNAPNLMHYEATHERMFRVIREANPTLPIIIVTRPKCNLSAGEITRREIAYKTYTNALEAGDKNVYFIDGSTLCSEAGDSSLVDGCHPTSLGFFLMARGIGKVLKEALKIK